MTGFCELGKSENFQVLQTVKCKCAQIAIKPLRRLKNESGRVKMEANITRKYRIV